MDKNKNNLIDPITLSLIRNSLSSIADEMANTIVRTAYSTVIRDCMDFSTALCDRHGQMIAQGVTIPFQLGSIPFALRATLNKYRGRIFPGDIFIMNDPFEGGIHLPDIFIFQPVFDDRDCLVGFSAVVAHHLDVGGRVPGSAACDNTEIFQEGLRIPPLKLYENDRPSESIFELLEKNVRVPEITMGDIRAKLSACKTGKQGLLKLVKQYGSKFLDSYYAELLNSTESIVRSEIRTWPNGEYFFEDFLDNDGVAPIRIPIKVKLIVQEDSLIIDFTGSSPQVQGGINSPLPFTISCCGYAVRSMMRLDIPNTSGLFRPMKVIAPEASILNPIMPAASSMRGVVGFRLSDALFGAMSQILPDRVPAAGEGGNSLIVIGGYTEQKNPFVMFDLVGGTWGGRPTKDGNDGLTNPGAVISNIPAELMELEYPIRLEQYALTKDSGGPGQYRGGLALTREWRYLGTQPANLTIRSDRKEHPPYGLYGGCPGAISTNIINPETKRERIVPTMVTDTLLPGEVIRHVQPGGGGWGNPLNRAPKNVLMDVLNHKVSLSKAKEDYGVCINPKTMKIKYKATEKKRYALKSKTYK